MTRTRLKIDDRVAGCAPILTSGCRNASSILSELTSVQEDGSLCVAVRHMGTPSTAELLGVVANPVTWDVGSVYGVKVPAPLRASTQRGYRDKAGASNAF